MEDDDNELNNHDTDQAAEDRQDTKRKRRSVEPEEPSENPVASTSKQEVVGDGTNAAKLVEEMGIELTCGCCTEMCYNPVIVLPCQHYYCGSCYTLWTRNGGVNCPSCRSAVTSIIPSRAIQSLIEVYLRAVPSRERLPREKEQADEIYVAGQSIRVPTPRPRSPEITAPQDNEAYYHPCPHCASPNDFNWSCPVPIISPTVNLTLATLLTAPVFPVGHARCGSCEHIHATRAPTSSKCDFCSLSFCGLVVPTRCHAKRVREQKPIGMDSLMDILGNPEVYEAFGVNAVEFDYLLDHLTSKEISPRQIYSEIVEPLASALDGWRPLLDKGLFPMVTEAERAPPARSNSNDSPPQEQPSSQSASPETAVEEPAPPETQPSSDNDQVMIDAVPETARETEPSTAAPSNSEAVPTSTTTETQNLNDVPPPDTSVQAVAEVTIVRPPTPIVVPERVPTPPIPEPTLDLLPVDVEIEQQPPSSTPAVVTETPELPAVTPQDSIPVSENTRNEEDDDEGDGSSSDRSASPPPVRSGDESTQTVDAVAVAAGAESTDAAAAAAAASAPPPRRGPHLHRICRTCAAEVFIWGARAWWIKERAKAVESGELAENVRSRKDCPDLGTCEKEYDNAHAREFNHIPHPPPSASTSGNAAADGQPGDNSDTAEPEQPASNVAETQPAPDAVMEAAPIETTSNGSDSSAPPAERPTSPERPSRAGSVNLSGDNMAVDAPAPIASTSVEGTTDAQLSLLPVNEEGSTGNMSAPELELESPENSIPSNSSGIDALAADTIPVNVDAVDENGEYSEKVLPTTGSHGDVHMVTHEDGETSITSSSVRAA